MVLIVSIPDIWVLPHFFILPRVPTRKKYRLLCYPLRSNSGWLPIRCAYFILLYSLCFDVFSRRYIREVLPNVPMFPEIKGRVPLPPNPSKIRYLMFPVHHYHLCSSVSIKSWPYFPRSREINAIFPVPKTPGRAPSILNFRFSLNKNQKAADTLFLITIMLIAKKHKRSRSNVLYDDSSGSSSKQEKGERKLLVGPLSKQCLSNSPEISGITFILLFYFNIMF